jgi:putative endonuclease
VGIGSQFLAFSTPFFAIRVTTPRHSSTILSGMPKKPDPKPVSEWTDARHVRGHDGEEEAEAFLVGQGWRLLERRFRLGHHDIDLIIRKGRQVAFVEVKTRTSRRFGSALESLKFRQRRAQTRVAQVWLERHGRPTDEYRFDLVAVDLTVTGPGRITHVPDAWRAER